MVNNIVTILFTILSIFTILLSYMITILCHHMVRIFYNIVTILAIITILCNNIVIIYGNDIVEIGNIVVKFDNIVDNIVEMCRPYCDQFGRRLLMSLSYLSYGRSVQLPNRVPAKKNRRFEILLFLQNYNHMTS